MLSSDVEGTPMNNINNVNKRPHPICVLGQAKRPREDGPREGATKQTKWIIKKTGPTGDATKTRAIAIIDSSESNRTDSDSKLSGGNDDTNHVEAPSDSTYYEGDEWLIKKSPPSTTRPVLPFF
jgi:hypothetical protein